MGRKAADIVVTALGGAAATVLLFMVLYTTYAVISRQFFGAPVLGVIDVMELALVFFIFIAMPAIFLRDENVVVDVIDNLVPATYLRILKSVALLIVLFYLGATLYEMIPQAAEKYNSYEMTMTLGIHKFIYWAPILFGFAASFLAVLWVLFRGPAGRKQADAAEAPETPSP
ncbi:MAG: TRAP transporter small permease [Hyphomicrobiales bacterium]|nr:TRAP transporter small permease [Hyphomicrobiales bacterium]